MPNWEPFFTLSRQMASPPPSLKDRVKVNIDGAMFEEEKSASLGAIV